MGGSDMAASSRGGADHDMGSRDFDDDQLFSMIMELDMAAPGEDGGMHSLDDSLMEQGAGGGRGSGAAGGNSAGDEDDDRMHPPRVTGARSTRGARSGAAQGARQGRGPRHRALHARDGRDNTCTSWTLQEVCSFALEASGCSRNRSSTGKECQ